MTKAEAKRLSKLACVHNAMCLLKVVSQNAIDRDFQKLMIKHNAMAICFEMKAITFDEACKILSKETKLFLYGIECTMGIVENRIKTLISDYPEFEDIIKKSFIDWTPDIYELFEILYKEYKTKIQH